jgi:Ca2+-dependent lipid-binding protein
VYNKQKLPAWCDRVLYASLPPRIVGGRPAPGFRLVPTAFEAVPQIATSDQKPVRALFDAEILELPPAIDDSAPPATINIRRLEGSSLLAADMNGLSDPYVKFIGSFLANGSERTPHIDCTLNPRWEDEQVPVLRLQVNSARRLRQHHLLFAVYDYDAASADDSIGCAALPLGDVVMDGYPSFGEWRDFKLDLTAGGLRAGQLRGQIQVCWQKPHAAAAAQ